jgi:hypothetical protein
MGYGERLGECHRKANMVTSELERIDNAAVAQAEEIHRLSCFLSPYLQPRTFSKEPAEAFECRPGLAGPRTEEEADGGPQPPFLHLRDELALLLGISGSNLVLSTWERHHLDPLERDPERLRPALLKLFATAARIAAPRGCNQGLKALLRGFENAYFPVSPAGKTSSETVENHRFSLLALIQTGRGANLLKPGVTTVLGTSATPIKSVVPPEPGADLTKLRREFLFESCCRAKSWTEAYRHSRVLSYGNPRPRLSMSTERRLAEVYRMNLGSGIPGSQKKNSC